MTLRGQTVFITGAARGIGEHVARVAAARGARVFLAGLEAQRLASLAVELGAGWHECDVTDQVALAAAVDKAIAGTGRIDTVVANAGVANFGTVGAGEVEALVRTVDVNLNGVIRTVHATLPHVRAARGYYLLISSAAAFTAMPGMAAYCAAKAGVENFGNVLRLELAHAGVAVGTAHPSWVDTDLVRDARADLPSFRELMPKLPWPLNQTLPVGHCANRLVRGIEKRSRRVYVPRSIGLVQALRTVVNSRLADTGFRRFGGNQVTRMEAETRAVGRAFGDHSMGLGGGAQQDARADQFSEARGASASEPRSREPM